ncbi:MAG TPA: Gfo/Idh/MocA family oxidoreductase, partial [bacterium]|nr:Gfo/Idh/MocA family oxidoreductase [bacterium]
MIKLNAVVIGGGMITKQLLLPVLLQEKKNGKISQIIVASRKKITIQRLIEEFPEAEIKGYPQIKDENPYAWKIALEKLQNPGIVIIATPDDLHAEMTLFAIEKGFDVIVQKPLCLTVKD